MIEDLYEFEKCYFINYFQVTPSYSEGGDGLTADEQDPRKKVGLFQKFKQNIQKKWRHYNYNFWKTSIYESIRQDKISMFNIKNNIGSVLSSKVELTEGHPARVPSRNLGLSAAKPDAHHQGALFEDAAQEPGDVGVLAADREGPGADVLLLLQAQGLREHRARGQERAVAVGGRRGANGRTTGRTSSTSRACRTRWSSCCS